MNYYQKRFYNIISIIFFLALIAMIVIRYQKEKSVSYDGDLSAQNYPSYIDENYPKQKVNKSLPHSGSNQYYDYYITYGMGDMSQLKVILTPKDKDAEMSKSLLFDTEQEIGRWIENHETKLTDVNIKWYMQIENKLTLLSDI